MKTIDFIKSERYISGLERLKECEARLASLQLITPGRPKHERVPSASLSQRVYKYLGRDLPDQVARAFTRDLDSSLAFFAEVEASLGKVLAETVERCNRLESNLKSRIEADPVDVIFHWADSTKELELAFGFLDSLERAAKLTPSARSLKPYVRWYVRAMDSGIYRQELERRKVMRALGTDDREDPRIESCLADLVIATSIKRFSGLNKRLYSIPGVENLYLMPRVLAQDYQRWQKADTATVEGVSAEEIEIASTLLKQGGQYEGLAEALKAARALST